MRDDFLALQILKGIDQINDPNDIINRLAKLYDKSVQRKRDIDGQANIS